MPAAGALPPRERCITDMKSSTVTNCSPVACTSRSVRPSAGRISAVSPVTTCERLSLVDTCTVSAQERSARSVAAVSGGGEVAAHRDQRLHPPAGHGPQGVHGVQAVLAGDVDAELCCQRVQEDRGHLLPDSHGPVAMDVGVPAHRAEAGAALADHPAQQRDVGDLAASARSSRSGPARARKPTRCRPSPDRGRVPRSRRSPRWRHPMNPRSSTVPGAASSASSRYWPRPWNSARSPPRHTCANSSASGVPRPSTPLIRCGFLKRSRPASGSGFTATIRRRALGLLQRDDASGDGWYPGSARSQDQIGGLEVGEGDRTLADADGRGQSEA